jgi:hypothetical protein
MSWSEDDDGLRSGAANSDEYEMTFGHHGEGGITSKQAARIADEVMANPHTAPPSNGVKPGPRRNRHLDGFGGRNNA